MLSIFHNVSILFSIEVALDSHPAVLADIFDSALLHIDQLRYDFRFTGVAQAESSSIAIRLSIFSEMRKARVTLAGTLCPSRIDLIEIAENSFDRSMHAVKVKAVKPDSFLQFKGVIVTS